YIKPDAVYLGIYEGLVLAGVHEVRNFWHSVVECHAVYDPGFRGEYALQGRRLFCKWLLENSPFLNSITMVPDTLVSSRNAATTTDNILLATFFSVDKDGFLATNGSTLTIQSNGAAFTATTIKIIAEQ
ncbi:tail needle knob protein, partial [Escherichia coli]